MKAAYVYKLRFPNGKSYIGVSVNPPKRFINHCLSKTLVGRAVAKYGKPNLEVLLKGTQEYCYEIEQKLIAAFNTLQPQGYNIEPGGRGGKVPTEHTLKKMRESHIGQRPSDETKAKMSAAQRNRPPVSDETKRRMSEAGKKRDISKFLAYTAAGHNKGKTWSVEQKAKQAERIKLWWEQRR